MLADGEVGDVDHLLHFTDALGEDLAVLERDQRAEIVLVAAQLVTDEAHGLTALRCRNLAPTRGDLDRGAHDVLVVLGARGPHLGDERAARRVADVQERTAGGARPAAGS